MPATTSFPMLLDLVEGMASKQLYRKSAFGKSSGDWQFGWHSLYPPPGGGPRFLYLQDR